jgi:hypothetical protein
LKIEKSGGSQMKIRGQNIRNKRGITLIALVITIIVLLILAGITINLTIGEGGIITTAQQAGKNYVQASADEQSDIVDLTDYLNAKTTAVGEKVADITKTTTIDGEETTVTIGRKISDGTGSTVPVPAGFYYVGGTVASGAVISDRAEDENKYKGQTVVGTDLVGNQYVFIPVDGTSLKYEQDHTYDSKHSNGYTSLSGWTDTYEGVTTSWGEDETSIAENKASVQTYGGFYIGRYEAGYPETITAGTTVVARKEPTSSQVPVSKAGYAAWNLINQTEAKTVSERLYGGESSTITSVTSKLIDSYAWDTTCRWLINSGVIQENSNGRIDSTSYGNYTNSTFTIPKGTLYVKHKYLRKRTDDVITGWYYSKGGAGKYTYLVVTDEAGMQLGINTESVTVPSDATLPEGVSTDANRSEYYTASEYIEIATGAVSNTRTNNIYDLAGNMWEWTTETIQRTRTSDSAKQTFTVLRGGSFSSNGSYRPVVYRSGDRFTTGTSIYIGYRVVLYIK